MTTPAAKAASEQSREFQYVARSDGTPSSIEPIPGFTTADLWNGYTPPHDIVKRLAAPSAVTVGFGQSGHFKSAIAIDLTMCVGTETPFHGIKVRKTGVLYVAGEGHGGIRKRMRAWLLAHGFDSTTAQPAVYVTSAAADLIGNPEQLRATVDMAAKALGVPIELVVIDTLAANFGAGDEYHSRDMGLAITNARQAAPDAAVFLVHHTGHNEQDRERGSYALIAAADFRLKITYDEVSKLVEMKWLKCKDDARPEPLVFEWRSIPLEWYDEDGEELTSVVLDRLEGATMPQGPRATGLGKNQEIAMKSLRALYAKARRNVEADGRNPADAKIFVDGWRADCERRGINRQRFHDLLNDLQKPDRRLIALDPPFVLLTEAPK